MVLPLPSNLYMYLRTIIIAFLCLHDLAIKRKGWKVEVTTRVFIAGLTNWACLASFKTANSFFLMKFLVLWASNFI
jgi:hypothetical protein